MVDESGKKSISSSSSVLYSPSEMAYAIECDGVLASHHVHGRSNMPKQEMSVDGDCHMWRFPCHPWHFPSWKFRVPSWILHHDAGYLIHSL